MPRPIRHIKAVCKSCGCIFHVFARAQRAYCGATCQLKGASAKLAASNEFRYTAATLESRCLKQSEPPNCWLWGGEVGQNGYGRVMRANRVLYVHRAMFEAVNGPIPTGLLVCHTCDVRHCANPSHLFLGTVADNSLDCVRKGRQSRVLSADQVLAARNRRAGGESLASIAREYGVTPEAIGAIVKRKNWRHL